MVPNSQDQVLETKETGKIAEIRDKADFRKLLALIIILGGGAYLWTKADPAQVIAYVFGIMSVAIGYFFNTTQSSQDKTKQISDLTKREVG
jgi:hypothetical protein